MKVLPIVFLLAASLVVAQQSASNQPPQPVTAQPTQTDFVSHKGFVLEDWTPAAQNESHHILSRRPCRRHGRF